MKRGAAIRYSDLSAARRRLVSNIRRYRFGYIERLHVKAGEPVWDPLPELTSQVKLGKTPQSEPVHDSEGATLTKEFLCLFHEFDERSDFTIKQLKFQNGIPLFREAKEPIV